MTPNYEFGPVFLIDAEAIGEPGHRTFRLVISSGHDVANLWLEKEQLHALGLAIRRHLATQRHRSATNDPTDLPTLENTPLPPASIEFRVGQLALGYDPDQDRLILQADDVAARPNEPYIFSCQITLAQARMLVQRVDAIIAAGRPLCPLCSAPLNRGETHVCPRSNGHLKSH